MLRLTPFLAGPAGSCRWPASVERRSVRGLSGLAYRTKRSPAFIALALAYAGMLVGCSQQNEYKPPPDPTVKVSRPVQQTVTNYLEETGTTEAVQQVKIRARVTGFLEEVKFEDGEVVEEGDELYVIEPRPFLAKVSAAKAKKAQSEAALKLAQADLARAEGLYAKKVIATAEYDLAVAKKEAAEAQVEADAAAIEQADIDLSYTKVTAPFTGRVERTLVKRGNLVDGNAATHLTTVIQYDPIYANFNISERELLELRERAPRREKAELSEEEKKEIDFYLQRDNDEGFPFKGHFSYADLGVDQSTGTFMVRGVFPNPDYDIVPGLFVRIRVPIGVQENALLVPERAVGADQAGRFVLIVNSENTVERRDVTLGTKVKEMVVINQGLQADEWVVIEGVQRARPGANVQREEIKLPAPEQEHPTEEATRRSASSDSSDDTRGQTETREDARAEDENSTTAGDQANS
jgi:RND family efflux transporter MFP subunit